MWKNNHNKNSVPFLEVSKLFMETNNMNLVDKWALMTINKGLNGPLFYSQAGKSDLCLLHLDKATLIQWKIFCVKLCQDRLVNTRQYASLHLLHCLLYNIHIGLPLYSSPAWVSITQRMMQLKMMSSKGCCVRNTDISNLFFQVVTEPLTVCVVMHNINK